MNLPTFIIIDVITVAILLVSALIGRRRGLIKTVSGIVALALAFSLAGTLSKLTAPIVSENLVVPHITSELTTELESTQVKSPASPTELSSFFKSIGVPENIISDSLNELSSSISKSITEPLTAMTHTVSYKITYSILFIIFFLVLLLVFTLLLKLVNLVAKIPGVNFINKTLGLILGLIFGYLIVVALSFTLTKTGVLLTNEIINKTVVLRFVSSLSPLSFF